MTTIASAEQERQAATPAPATATVELSVAPNVVQDRGTTAGERRLLGLQRAAGNAAVTEMLGVQRAPLQRAPLQRAPETALDPPARVDRLRLHAIKFVPMVRHMLVDVEAAATALADMTADEGRSVKRLFEEKTTWNLGWLIAGYLEIGDKPVTNNIGPANRRRLLNLLSGTVAAPQVDPMAAMAAAEARGEDAAAAAVAARDKNIEEQKRADTRRLRAQATEIKVWLDKGQKERIFALLRKLATPAGRDERRALGDAYEQQFGEQLYIALTKRMKGRDWERVSAFWDEDPAKADRLATEIQLEKVKRAEEKAKALGAGPAGSAQFVPPGLGKAAKEAQQRSRAERAALEEHLEVLAERPAEQAAPTAEGEPPKSQLEAVLDDSGEGKALGEKLANRKDAVINELVGKSKRPQLLAVRLARSLNEGTLKATDIEAAFRELRAAAQGDAKAEAVAAAAPAAGAEATAAVAETKAPPSAELLRETYFAQFQERFAQESGGRPLINVLTSIGSQTDVMRNLALLSGRGLNPDWLELYLALRPERKDMERVRAILGHKTRRQIATIADEYKKLTPGHSDLTQDLLGTAEQRRLIERLPAVPGVDLGKAREELEEKKSLLRGGTFEAEPATGGEAELASIADELKVRQEAARAAGPFGARPGGPPVGDERIAGLASLAADQAELRQLREKANFVFGRLSTFEVSVTYNRGQFARARDWLGNVEHSVVEDTKTDAAKAMKAFNDALAEDPPNVALAQKLVDELSLIESRMRYNIGVYKERTEEAFNSFVDAAVMIASTIATAGQGGAILMAIRATAATIATKVTLKGGDYGAEEFWADVRGGVFSAVGGKLSEKFVGGLAEAIAVRYAKRAEKLGLTKSWKTWALTKAGAVAQWEADNLVSGVAAGIPEALIQDDLEHVTTSMSLESHATAAGQHLATSMIKGGRAAAARRKTAKAQAKAQAEAAARRRLAEPEPEPARRPAEEAEAQAEPAGRPPEKDAQPAEVRRPPEGLPEAAGGRPRIPESPPLRPVDQPAVRPTAKTLAGDGGHAPPPKPPAGAFDPVGAKLVPGDTSSSLQEFANNHDLVIKVRPMNAEAIARLQPQPGAGGVVEPAAMPKPDIIKAKSINELDEHIGGPLNSRGYVGLFEPHPPSKDLPPEILAAATKRFEDRAKEWKALQRDYGDYMKQGIMHIEGGLVLLADPRVAGPDPQRGALRKVAGDVDIFDITHADGRPLSVDEMNHVEQRLRSMGIAVEHGAHKHWPSQHRESYEKNRDVYERIIEQHTADTPLVAYVPREKPQQVFAGTDVKRAARRDRPGERIMPLDEPPVIVSSEYLKQVEATGRGVEARPGAATPETTPTVPERGAATAPGSARSAQTVPAGPAPTPERPKGRPLFPEPQVPSDLTPAAKPTFDLMMPKAEQFADPKRDIAVEPGFRSATPTAAYEPPQPGRYVPTGDKPTEGLSADKSFIVSDTTDNDKRYLFKPLEAEQPVGRAEERGVRAEEQAPREVGAAIAGEALGVDVPKSRLVTIVDANGVERRGVLVEWHEKNTLQDLKVADPRAFLRLINSEQFKAAITRLDALDYLINNLDRGTNFGNYMYDFLPDGTLKLTAIDHGLSFTSTQERADIKAFTRELPETYPIDLVERLETLDRDRAAFIEKIKPFVGEGAIPGVIHRLDLMLADMRAKRAKRG